MAGSSGSKLRTTSVVILVIALVAALGSGIFLMVTTTFWAGLVPMLTYALIGYFAFIMLQAFADIADNTAYTAETNSRILTILENQNGYTQGGFRKPVQGNPPGYAQGNPQRPAPTAPQGYSGYSQAPAREEQAGCGTTTCPKCGKVQPASRARCINCGEMLF